MVWCIVELYKIYNTFKIPEKKKKKATKKKI